MSHKKIIAILMALICAAAIALGGCNIHQQETETTQSSNIEHSKNNLDSSVKSNKDSTKDKKSEDSKSDTAADDSTENTANAESNSATFADDKNSTRNTASSSSSNHSGSSNNSGSTSKPSGGTSSQNKPVETQPVHQHSYTDHSEVIQAASCSTTGTQRNFCSCGEHQDVTIAATGNHEWVDRYEQQQKSIPIWKEVCNGCGAQFDTADEALDHVMSSPAGSACRNYSSKIVGYNTSTEDVFIGKQCDTCKIWQ